VLLWLLRIALAFDGLSTILTLIKISLPATPPLITALQHLLRVPLIAIPVVCVSLAILTRIEPIINIPDSLVPVAIAGKELLGLGGGFVLLAITQTIVNAMQLKVHQINYVEETAHL